MFNLGVFEILILLVLALVFVGPEKLPELARTVARLLNELRHATDDITRSVLDAKPSNPFDKDTLLGELDLDKASTEAKTEKKLESEYGDS